VRNEALANVQAAVAGLRGAADRLEQQTLPVAGLVEQEQPPARSRGFGRRRHAEVAAPVAGAPVTDGHSPSDDLYRRAKELGIRGHKKMTKPELEEAVRTAHASPGKQS